MEPTQKWENIEKPRFHITRFTSVPNLGQFHGGLVIFHEFPPLFVRKPLSRHIYTMGPPWSQLKNGKTLSNQGFTSQGSQVCQILANSMVVWSFFMNFPLFSSENPCLDTSTPWGHHGANSKMGKH